jgi:hypothetical protein
MSASREQDYITIVRQYNRSIWEGIHALNAMRAEWDALDYSTTRYSSTRWRHFRMCWPAVMPQTWHACSEF